MTPRSTDAEWLAPDRVLSMGQIELFDISAEYIQMIYVKLNC